jgi:hypothetical protein
LVPPTRGQHPQRSFDLQAYMEKHSFSGKRVKPWKDGAQIFELVACPFDVSHNDGSAAFTLSSSGNPGFTCKHNGCFGRSIRDVFKQYPPEPQCGRQGRLERATSEFSIASIPSIWSYNATVSWIIDGLIIEGGVTLLTGESGVGKSTLALALCGSVVHGVPFIGRQTKRSKVVYIDKENPASVVRERLARLKIEETEDLKVWGDWVDVPPQGPNHPAILDYAREHQSLFVFDSLVAFHTGSEQDASETRKHMQLYKDIASTGASVIVLHHTGKSDGSKQYRGSSDIKAVVDACWLLEGASGSTEGLRSFVLQPFKSRAVMTEPIHLEYVEGVFSARGAHMVRDREQMNNIVRDHRGKTQTNLVRIAVGIGIAKNRAEQLLSEGENDGNFKVRKGHKGAKYYTLASDAIGRVEALPVS